MGPKRGERLAGILPEAEVVGVNASKFGLDGHMEEMRQEAIHAIQSGDYLKAKELALLLNASAVSSMPNSMS